jgi:hypothetical protein
MSAVNNPTTSAGQRADRALQKRQALGPGGQFRRVLIMGRNQEAFEKYELTGYLPSLSSH